MKSSRRYVSILAVLFAISISLAFVGGCTSNAVAPSTDNSILSTLDWLSSDITTGQADRSPKPPELDKIVSGLIGSQGGVLQVKLDGSTPAIFKFPKGALKTETLITIHASVLQSPYGDFVVYECGPEGTVFDVPLEVSQPMPPSKSAASLYYFNETTMQWEVQETSTVQHGAAKFHIYHFSKYGIS